METLCEPTGSADTSWVISEGKFVRRNPIEFDPEAGQGAVKEYRISEIGRYLLCPGPIEIRKRLVGCEAHPPRSRLSRLLRCWPWPRGGRQAKAELILSGLKLKLTGFKDPELEAHFGKIDDELRPMDPFSKKIGRLDRSHPCQLIGVCEDAGNGYSYLQLQGSLEEKIRYLTSYMGRDVGVTIRQAHLSEGLFELRAFPPAGFDPAHSFRLYTYSRDEQPAACVLTPIGNLDFRLPDPGLMKYLSLLQQSLNASPDLKRAFDTCFLTPARPVRLFFNRQLGVDYSEANLPEIYRDVLRTSGTAASGRSLVKPVLNYLQTAVSLSYLPAPESGEDRAVTHICILHDLRALDPLRKSLPAVYAEMSRRAFSSEAGRYYVLDSVTGATHAE
jgi:hypothetical protein